MRLMRQDHGAVCNTDNLDARPTLWRIICLNAHPPYTFDITSALDASPTSADSAAPVDAFAAALIARVVLYPPTPYNGGVCF